jgi:hypothetical protein
MPKIKGFGPIENLQIKSAIRSARQCIDAALNMAVKHTDTFQIRMNKYFSMTEPNVTSLVLKVMNSMKLTIDTDYYYIEKCAQIQNRNAECASWQMQNQQGTMSYQQTAWFNPNKLPAAKQMNVLEAQIENVVASGPSKMSIFPLFFGLPVYRADSQCQIQSFLHELSHVSGGTTDVTDNGTYPYGMDGVRTCITLQKSGMNAENVAMFVASFH